MKIVLLGYMGSGKTAMGRMLARQANLAFIDLDHYIEQVEELSIPEIFHRYGEGGFRQIESFHLRQVMEHQDHFVLSLGGGTPCFNDNMDYLHGACTSIYLSASPIALAERLACSTTKRPLLQGKTRERTAGIRPPKPIPTGTFLQKGRLRTLGGNPQRRRIGTGAG